jgi:hypothetical protein
MLVIVLDPRNSHKLQYNKFSFWWSRPTVLKFVKFVDCGKNFKVEFFVIVAVTESNVYVLIESVFVSKL